MLNSPYSSLKVFHHQEQLDLLKKGQVIVPAQVQLIISDLCNQDCSFCSYRISNSLSNQLFVGDSKLAKIGTNNPIRFIPYDKIIEILDDCKEVGVKAIQLTGGGEPTVHPQYDEVFNAVLDRGLELALVTNGVRLNDYAITALAQAKWVRFSIDSGSKESYSRIRGVDPRMWYQAWDSVIKLIDRREKICNEDLIIGIGFVVTKDNWKEVVQCTQMARDAGVDNIRISAMFQSEDDYYFKDFYSEVKELIHNAKSLATDKFQVFDNFGDRYTDLKQHNPDYEFCGYQFFNMYIGGDLNIYRCCVLAYNSRGLVGSLKNQRFKDWLSTIEREKAYIYFNAKECTRCMFNDKNRIILYALLDNPKHVNFV